MPAPPLPQSGGFLVLGFMGPGFYIGGFSFDDFLVGSGDLASVRFEHRTATVRNEPREITIPGRRRG